MEELQDVDLATDIEDDDGDGKELTLSGIEDFNIEDLDLDLPDTPPTSPKRPPKDRQKLLFGERYEHNQQRQQPSALLPRDRAKDLLDQRRGRSESPATRARQLLDERRNQHLPTQRSRSQSRDSHAARLSGDQTQDEQKLASTTEINTDEPAVSQYASVGADSAPQQISSDYQFNHDQGGVLHQHSDLIQNETVHMGYGNTYETQYQDVSAEPVSESYSGQDSLAQEDSFAFNADQFDGGDNYVEEPNEAIFGYFRDSSSNDFLNSPVDNEQEAGIEAANFSSYFEFESHGFLDSAEPQESDQVGIPYENIYSSNAQDIVAEEPGANTQCNDDDVSADYETYDEHFYEYTEKIETTEHGEVLDSEIQYDDYYMGDQTGTWVEPPTQQETYAEASFNENVPEDADWNDGYYLQHGDTQYSQERTDEFVSEHPQEEYFHELPDFDEQKQTSQFGFVGFENDDESEDWLATGSPKSTNQFDADGEFGTVQYETNDVQEQLTDKPSEEIQLEQMGSFGFARSDESNDWLVGDLPKESETFPEQNSEYPCQETEEPSSDIFSTRGSDDFSFTTIVSSVVEKKDSNQSSFVFQDSSDHQEVFGEYSKSDEFETVYENRAVDEPEVGNQDNQFGQYFTEDHSVSNWLSPSQSLEQPFSSVSAQVDEVFHYQENDPSHDWLCQEDAVGNDDAVVADDYSEAYQHDHRTYEAFNDPEYSEPIPETDVHSESYNPALQSVDASYGYFEQEGFEYEHAVFESHFDDFSQAGMYPIEHEPYVEDSSANGSYISNSFAQASEHNTETYDYGTGYAYTDTNSYGSANSHAFLCFGFGGKMVTHFPSYDSKIVRLSSTKSCLKTTEFLREVEGFLGPLTLETPLDVLDAIVEQECMNVSMSQYVGNPDASQLLWKLLQIFAQDGISKTLNTEKGTQRLLDLLADRRHDEHDENFMQEYHEVYKTRPSPRRDEEKNVVRLEEFVMSGDISGGINYCIENSMWEHALLLSSIEGPQAFTQVASTYANMVLADATALQTLYTLRIGPPRQIFQSLGQTTGHRLSVSEVPLVKNWKSTVSVILTNPGDYQSQILLELGDTLLKHFNQFEAAQFCYLLTGLTLGDRIQVLGTQFRGQRLSSIPATFLQQTELFELAHWRENAHNVVPSFQPFKLAYAMLLIDLGLIDQANDYLTLINYTVQNTPQNQQGIYTPHFLEDLALLEARLALITTKSSAVRVGGADSLFGSFVKGFSSMFVGDSDDDNTSKRMSPQAVIKGEKALSEEDSSPKDSSTSVKDEGQSGFLRGFFRRKEVRQAILPEENTVRWDEVSQRWIIESNEETTSDGADAEPSPEAATTPVVVARPPRPQPRRGPRSFRAKRGGAIAVRSVKVMYIAGVAQSEVLAWQASRQAGDRDRQPDSMSKRDTPNTASSSHTHKRRRYNQRTLSHVDAMHTYDFDQPVCKSHCRGRQAARHPQCFIPVLAKAKKHVKSIWGNGFWSTMTALRERRVKELLNPIIPNNELITEILETEYDMLQRKPGIPVGINNLGATCYMNSFAQCLFMNRKFRSYLYRFDETFAENDEDFTVVKELQILFGMLQDSERNAIDADDFATALMLDSSEQQDAQEFTKLLLDYLDRKLHISKDPFVSNLISSLFLGNLTYTTVCSTCNLASKSQSDFYELRLQIKGHQGVQDSLCSFFNDEILDGREKYLCAKCNSKQNATRRVEVGNWPKYLNVQLMRFQYDIEKQRKVKIQNKYNIPLKLNLSDTNYILTAVLQHVGSTAYSGHYVADIMDEVSGSWFNFDDHVVSESDKNKGGSEDHFTSQNAYLLVYCRENSEESDNLEINVPEWIKRRVSKQNQEFRQHQRISGEIYAELERAIESRKSWIARLQDHIKNDFVDSERHPAATIAVNRNYLETWCAGTEDEKMDPTSQITGLLCEHGKLDPELSNAKISLLPLSCGDIIFPQYVHLIPFISLQSLLCLDCCQRIVSQDFQRKEAEEVGLLIWNDLKQKNVSSGYWINKKWVSEFRDCRKRRNIVDLQNFFSSSFDEVALMKHLAECWFAPITCGHGSLTTDRNLRRLVSKSALMKILELICILRFDQRDEALKWWNAIKSTCSRPEFADVQAQGCSTCLEIENNLYLENMKQWTKRIEIWEAVKRVLCEKKYRNLNRNFYLLETGYYYLAPRDWVESVAEFLTSSPDVSATEPLLSWGELICSHEGALTMNHTEIIRSGQYSIITEEVWKLLETIHLFSSGIKVYISEDKQFSFKHRVCVECQLKRKKLESYKMQHYEITKFIHIRDSMMSYLPEAPKMSERKSQRARRASKKSSSSGILNTLEVLISSDDTIYDLKLKIMEQSGMVPNEQEIYIGLDKIADEDLAKTLQELQIRRDAHITVVAVEITEEESVRWQTEEILAKSQMDPELGFSGTVLTSTPRKDVLASSPRKEVSTSSPVKLVLTSSLQKEEPASTPVAILQDPYSWTCNACTLINPLGLPECGLCGAPIAN